MPNWTESMQQYFEYFTVDPGTWRDIKKLDNVKGCSISRDQDSNTLGSASIDIVDSLEECYVRVYLVTIQNGITERHPLGTFLVQTPTYNFDGKITSTTVDAYTPLLELNENQPPIGYYIPENSNIMDIANQLVLENARAHVVPIKRDDKIYYDFVADTNDTWLTFVKALIANINLTLDLDEIGRILFAPKRETKYLQPVWSYDDDNSSILYSDVTISQDLYDIPNTVEVIHSKGSEIHYVKVVNNDPNSPTSVQKRGRTITTRVVDPDLNGGNPTYAQVEEYANRLLEELSTVEYTVSYSHAYCPVRLGDCVLLNYKRAGLDNVKAKVISQTIKCDPGCPVQEKAIYTVNLWR